LAPFSVLFFFLVSIIHPLLWICGQILACCTTFEDDY
jgi:hypothetical protein